MRLFAPRHILLANKTSAKLYEIGAGTTEVRKIVIGRVSLIEALASYMTLLANMLQAFNKEYSSYAS